MAKPIGTDTELERMYLLNQVMNLTEWTGPDCEEQRQARARRLSYWFSSRYGS